MYEWWCKQINNANVGGSWPIPSLWGHPGTYQGAQLQPNNFICFRISGEGNNPVSLLPISGVCHLLLRRFGGQVNVSSFVSRGEKQLTLNESFAGRDNQCVWMFLCQMSSQAATACPGNESRQWGWTSSCSFLWCLLGGGVMLSLMLW